MQTPTPLKPRPDEDPMWALWQAKAPEIYERIYYQSNPVVAAINLSGHRLIERTYPNGTHFGRVLEVGAGTGIHLDFVRHSFDDYLVTDINADLLDKARERHAGDPRPINYEIADALALPYPDASFDRVVSVYNLEHLPEPHRVLEEWRRVLKPGGVLSVAIPAEGGIPWNLGRHLTTRRSFAREGLDLDYIIAREHINACYRLVSLLRHYFEDRDERWYPVRIPTPHLNLVFACNCRTKVSGAPADPFHATRRERTGVA